jgi:hypothetical protein
MGSTSAQRIGRFAFAVLAAVGYTACTKPTDPAAVATIQLQPGNDSIELGHTFNSWIVTLRDRNGDAITGRQVSWESLNTNVATIDGNGVVTGIGTGTTVITVRADGKSAQASIKVLSPILSIVATPDSFDLPMTTARAISVQLVGPGGQALTGRTITWSTSNIAVASVSTTGVVTPISEGTVTVTIRAGTQQAEVRVRVVAEPVASVRITPQQSVHIIRLGQAIQLGAECLNALGQVLIGRTITWNTSNPIVATVSTSGFVSGIALGQSNISATCANVGAGNVSSQVVAQVTPVPVSTVTIAPAQANLFVNWPGQQLTATARDSANNVLSLQGRSVIWSSDNLPVATVSGQGVVSGQTAGVAQISVTVDGVASQPINANVQNAPVASVVISVPPQVKVGNQHQMGVTLRDALNNVLNGRVVIWNSSNQAVATIDANGVVLAIAVGNTMITATSEGVAALGVQLTVIP